MANPSLPESKEPPAGQEDPTEKMSFFDHLAEMRRRIIHSLVAVGFGL